MKITVDNQIVIEETTKEIVQAIQQDLKVKNPVWIRNNYLGHWNGKIPEYLYFYEVDGDNYIVPFGYARRLNQLIADIKEHYEWDVKIKNNTKAKSRFVSKINLRDYQQAALALIDKKKNGIVVMPAGSGKTLTAIKTACEIGHKTLWITHTIDLLNQAYNSAKDNGVTGLGKIAGGQVSIGAQMTFATVQTLSKLDLNKYKDTWGTIIVDECHRVCGTPASVTMFYKCISSLSARYKIGLTATPERKEKGTEKAMFALLGDIITEVPREAVKKLHAQIEVVKTGYELGDEATKTDGTIDYTKATELIGKDQDRNDLIVDLLGQNRNHYCLILGDRVEHLESLQKSLGMGATIHGKTNKILRESNLRAIKAGNIHFLFATYQLAKEGLDIPRLDRLFLVAPRDDKAVIVQAVGRIERLFEGKETPIVHDFVDEGEYFQKKYKKRKTIYKKNGNEVIE